MPRDEYSDFLVRAATTKRDLIARLERTFAKVVESPELKRQPLPVMKSEDRQVAHELAAHYGNIARIHHCGCGVIFVSHMSAGFVRIRRLDVACFEIDFARFENELASYQYT